MPPKRRRVPLATAGPATARAYTADLRDVWRDYEDEVRRRVLPHVEATMRAVRAEEGRFDQAEEGLVRLLDGALLAWSDRWSPTAIAALARRRARTAESLGAQDLARQARRLLGIDIAAAAPGGDRIISTWVAENVDLIRTIPRTHHERVRRIVRTAGGEGLRHTEVRAQIEAEFGVSKRRAAVIARDQANKLNGQLTRDRHAAAGVRSFIWRTSLDGRVRDRHTDLEGRIFSYPDGHSSEGIPGQPIQCRCTAEPVFPEDDAGQAGEEAQPAPQPAPRDPRDDLISDIRGKLAGNDDKLRALDLAMAENAVPLVPSGRAVTSETALRAARAHRKKNVGFIERSALDAWGGLSTPRQIEAGTAITELREMLTRHDGARRAAFFVNDISMAASIRRGLRDAPRFTGEVFRGISVPRRGPDREIVSSLIDSLTTPGKVVEMRGLQSWSDRRGVAERFTGARQTSQSDVGVLLRVETERGAFIEPFTRTGEREVLLDTGRFRVESVDRSGPVPVVTLKDLGVDPPA